jgi:2-desacetyl-2-hydroxyethyl bacteriochlorophyllide A dehydrogenase
MALYYLGNGKFELGNEKETSPGRHQIKVKVFYSGICGTDYHIAKGELDGRIAEFPRIIGHEASGEIIEVGEDVKRWEVGDRVVIRPLQSCHSCEECKAGNENICTKVRYLGIESDGSFQKNWIVDENVVHRIPEEIGYPAAALAEPLAVCCHAVKRSEIASGQKAVVIGGGPIGIMTALVLKSKGSDVIVSEMDSRRLEHCKEFGIEMVNPTEEDLLSRINDWTGGRGVSVVFEASGSQSGLGSAHELLHANGKIVTIATYGKVMNLDIRKLHLKQLTLVTTRAYQKDDFESALTLLQQNLPASGLITKIVPLTELKEYLENTAKGTSEIKVLVDCQQ